MGLSLFGSESRSSAHETLQGTAGVTGSNDNNVVGAHGGGNVEVNVIDAAPELVAAVAGEAFNQVSEERYANARRNEMDQWSSNWRYGVDQWSSLRRTELDQGTSNWRYGEDLKAAERRQEQLAEQARDNADFLSGTHEENLNFVAGVNREVIDLVDGVTSEVVGASLDFADRSQDRVSDAALLVADQAALSTDAVLSLAGSSFDFADGVLAENARIADGAVDTIAGLTQQNSDRVLQIAQGTNDILARDAADRRRGESESLVGAVSDLNRNTVLAVAAAIGAAALLISMSRD